jgi:hypothetical protein
VRLSRASLLALFALGAGGGLLGDQGHVASSTTQYFSPARRVPFIWESPLWFPLLVGLLTASLGELRARIGVERRAGTLSEGLAAVAAVLGLYALTALIRHQPLGPGTVLIYALAVVTWRAFGGGLAAAACGAVAVAVGVTSEIVLVAAGVFRYAHGIDVLLGVAPWLPALYFAFGVVVARLAELLSPARAAGGEPADDGDGRGVAIGLARAAKRERQAGAATRARAQPHVRGGE